MTVLATKFKEQNSFTIINNISIFIEYGKDVG